LKHDNVFADAIGLEHGITKEQWKRLSAQTAPLIAVINEERKKPGTRYGTLHSDMKIAESVMEQVGEFREKCENLVVLGIGGSALGNIALQTALNPYMYNLDAAQRKGGPRLFVFDNVDPQQFGSFLDWLNDRLDKTLFNVISKSGRTAETAGQFLTVRKLLIDRLGRDSLKDHILATTDAAKGTLRKIATEADLKCLEVPDGVGGRFSVLSAVGLFSAAMCGIDIEGLLSGARDMDNIVANTSFEQNPAAINAAINWHYYNLGKTISVMFSYSYALKDFADWYRQLWAESLGKTDALDGSKVHVGPTPVNALGTTDQHSQVQLYREGPNNKIFTFLEVEDLQRPLEIGPAPESAPELAFLAGKDMGDLLNVEKTATEYALMCDHRPCLTVKFPRIDAYTVGQFIFLFEVTTSFMGRLFNINTYNQPAVELGKEATFALMGRMGKYKDNQTYEQFADEIRAKTHND
jgi:glucose-6-phosphate isomerase